MGDALHEGLVDVGAEDEVDDPVLRRLLVGVVLEERADGLLGGRDEVDRVQLGELLAAQLQLLQRADPQLHQLGHLHVRRDDLHRLVVHHQQVRARVRVVLPQADQHPLQSLLHRVLQRKRQNRRIYLLIH